MNARTLQAPTGERPSIILTSTVETYRRTCRGETEFRIQGLFHPAVQEHEHIRKQAVQKLIHQFENHPNKEALQADLKQNRAFNAFSEQSKEMIYSIRNMEARSLLTYNAPTVCMTNKPKGIGTVLRLSDKVRKLNSDRYYVLSISNYVIKNGPSHGRRHENTERQNLPSSHVSEKKGFTSIRDRLLRCPI